MDNLDEIIELLDDGVDNNVVGIMVNILAENPLNRLGDVDRDPANNHRNRNYYEEIILHYNLDDFYNHFRMSRETFQLLLNTIRPVLPDNTHIPLEKKLLFSIWFLAKQESFLSTGDRFNFAKSTAHKIFFEICNIIASFMQQFIVWPNDQKKRLISQDFRMKCGIPGIVGAIDGTHIEIKAPTNNQIDFYNRNNYHSIILQGVCDNQMIFTDIFVGCPGRMHDARVFHLSPIYEALSNNQLLPDHQHLLGDAAYPISLFLIKPYRDNGHLTNTQIRFNTKLSTARSVIERAYGQLKGKFRRLKYLDMSNADMIPVVVTTACVLHNFIIINEKTVYENFDDGGNNDDHRHDGNRDVDGDRRYDCAAEQKRNELAAIL